tara:strand:+ start:1651 stop:1872 length:222 start_codon:yes stop_codon:yes gene_type:complete
MRQSKFHRDIPNDMKMDISQDQVNVFLDNLRESGATNMFGAGSYIQQAFGVTKYDANRFLTKWMDTFNERHSD